MKPKKSQHKLIFLLVIVLVIIAAFIALAITKPQLPLPVNPADIILGEWTTDQPVSYSPLVTIVFSNATRGVEYAYITDKGYMAAGFTYKIDGSVITITNDDTQTLAEIPFKFPDSQALILNINGQNITFIRDKQDKAYLQNKY